MIRKPDLEVAMNFRVICFALTLGASLVACGVEDVSTSTSQSYTTTTIALRPNANGTDTSGNWKHFSCSSNYDCVDDVTADDDTTYLYCEIPGTSISFDA